MANLNLIRNLKPAPTNLRDGLILRDQAKSIATNKQFLSQPMMNTNSLPAMRKRGQIKTQQTSLQQPKKLSLKSITGGAASGPMTLIATLQKYGGTRTYGGEQ